MDQQVQVVPFSVVVADDHALSRRELVRALDAHSGLSVVGEAADGRAAVLLVRRLRPDVALLDVRMPCIDGLQAAQQIRDECPTPVVLLSAFDSALYRDAASAAGAYGFVAKDAQESELIDAVLAAGRHGRDECDGLGDRGGRDGLGNREGRDGLGDRDGRDGLGDGDERGGLVHQDGGEGPDDGGDPSDCTAHDGPGNRDGVTA